MKLRIEFVMLVLGFVLTVAGAASYSIAAALIVAGVLVILITLLSALIERL